MDPPPSPASRHDRTAAAGKPFAAVAETHTGVAIFLGERATLKRPVQFPFLDHRDVDARPRACEQEVALNRRLAPDVYLGIGALIEPTGGPGGRSS